MLSMILTFVGTSVRRDDLDTFMLDGALGASPILSGTFSDDRQKYFDVDDTLGNQPIAVATFGE